MNPDKIAAQGLDPPIPAIFFADAVPAFGQTHLAISDTNQARTGFCKNQARFQ
jgi:hypothetical protein